MWQQTDDVQDLVFRVTREEYEQFVAAETELPPCVQQDQHGRPICDKVCPAGLVCITFVYADPERGIDTSWFACGTPEEVRQLTERGEMTFIGRATPPMT